MKFLWTWAALLLGLIAFARAPSQPTLASTNATSNMTLVISDARPTLPDTNVDPDTDLSGPVLEITEQPAGKVPSLGNSTNHLAIIGLLILGVVAGYFLGRRIRNREVMANV